MNTTNIRKINLEASTVEDAVRRVALELNVPESWLQAKILSEGKGFFGLFGKKLQLEITVNPKPVEQAENVEKKNNGVEPGKPVSDNINEEEVCKLMNESKIFADKLMKKMELNVSPQISGKFLSLDGDDSAIVIGRYGDTLRAIEYLLNLCVRESKDVPRIRLDSDGYRDRRTASLQRLAISAAKKAAGRGVPIRLEPMASWERRIIHITLKDRSDVVTESIGESPERKVIVMPRVNYESKMRPRRRSRR